MDALLWLAPGISIKPRLKTGAAWLTGSLVQFLADEAVFVAGSVRTASQGFWPLRGLLLLVNSTTRGMAAIWDRLTDTGLGLLVAVVRNAYIAIGLVPVIMVYFWNRYPLAQKPKVPAS